MKKLACSLSFWLIPAIAYGASCDENFSTLAVKLSPNTAVLISPSDLRFELPGKPPFQLDPSPNQKLPGYWTYPTPPLVLAKIRGLMLSATCMKFSPRGIPFVDHLPDGKADELCYAVVQFDAEPTCWSLRVRSDPQHYPFQVTGREKRIFRDSDSFNKNWNLERDLPKKPVEVKIFDLKHTERCLYAIDKVTTVTIADGPSKLDQVSLAQYPCKKLGTVDADARTAVQEWEKDNPSPLDKIKSIELLVEEKMP